MILGDSRRSKFSCLHFGGLSFTETMTETTKDFKSPENHISLHFFARFVLLQFIFSEPLIPPLLRAYYYYIVKLARTLMVNHIFPAAMNDYCLQTIFRETQSKYRVVFLLNLFICSWSAV